MGHKHEQFPPLESVTRPTVETAAAAYYLNRRPQTLRGYEKWPRKFEQFFRWKLWA